ncbi:MAG TPA: hypothetical protein VIP11_10660 [Gemmatimonadaceae bacterium]
MSIATVAACGGDATNPNNSQVSPAEARAIASALFGEVAHAVGSPTPSSASRNETPSATPPQTASVTVNATCSGGGTLKGTFDFTSDLNAAGTGTQTGNLTVTAAQCTFSTGERTISADGGYQYAFNVGLTNFRPSSNFVWKATGTLNWTGGSCTLDYTVEIAPNGARTLSGTVCGVDVKGSVTA